MTDGMAPRSLISFVLLMMLLLSITLPSKAATNSANLTLVELADWTWSTLIRIHKDVWGDKDPTSKSFVEFIFMRSLIPQTIAA